jgi:cytochrome c551/c552
MRLVILLSVGLLLSACVQASAQQPEPTAENGISLTATVVPSPTPVATVTPVATLTPEPAPTLEPTPEPTVTPAVGASGEGTTTQVSAPVDIEPGIAIYRKSYCGHCHSLAVAGTRGIFAPNHDQMGTIAEERIAAANYRGSATTAAAYIRESIVEPRAYIVDGYQATPHHMPAYTNLSDDELDAMVNMLLQQR